MAAKPAPSDLAVVVEAVSKGLREGTREMTDFVAAQTSGIKEERSDFKLERVELSRLITELRGQVRDGDIALRAAESKNLDRDVAFRRLENENERHKAWLGKISEFIDLTKVLGTEVAHAFGTSRAVKALKEDSTGATTVCEVPPAEILMKEIIADLKPATISILWSKAGHAMLPLLASKSFLHNAFQFSEDPEVKGPLFADLGPSAVPRLLALGEAAGLFPPRSK